MKSKAVLKIACSNLLHPHDLIASEMVSWITFWLQSLTPPAVERAPLGCGAILQIMQDLRLLISTMESCIVRLDLFLAHLVRIWQIHCAVELRIVVRIECLPS